MQDAQRLAQRIAELQEIHERLRKKRAALERDKVLETRSEEKLRLEYQIKDTNAELQNIEQQLRDLEAQQQAIPQTPEPQKPKGDYADAPQVFICYAREDRAWAERIYNDLQQAGVKPWLDCKDILPGQRWKSTIKKAMKESAYFLALLSNQSVSKTGYVQKELREALDLLEHRPPSEIFLIPVRIEECEPEDDRLHEIQWVDLFEPYYEAGFRRILQVICPPIPEPPPTREQEQSSRPEPKKPPTPTQKPPATQATPPPVQLRSTPKIVSTDQAQQEFGLTENGRPVEYIQNNYEDQGEVVLDHATGLMWQKSRSEDRLTYEDAQTHVKQLNQQQFAGYDDWRLPTIPELMSLLELEKSSNGLYINPIFDAKQWGYWSADRQSSSSAWSVGFHSGRVRWRSIHYPLGVRVVRSWQA